VSGCNVPACAATETHLFISGRFCPVHTPAATAGRPEPGRTGDSSWMSRIRHHTLAGTKGASDINKERPGGYKSRQSGQKDAAVWTATHADELREASQRW